MTYIDKEKVKKYEEKIKDYSENMLSYELSECEITLEAEERFGADKIVVANIKTKMKIIQKVIEEHKNKKVKN